MPMAGTVYNEAASKGPVEAIKDAVGQLSKSLYEHSAGNGDDRSYTYAYTQPCESVRRIVNVLSFAAESLRAPDEDKADVLERSVREGFGLTTTESGEDETLLDLRAKSKAAAKLLLCDNKYGRKVATAFVSYSPFTHRKDEDLSNALGIVLSDVDKAWPLAAQLRD